MTDIGVKINSWSNKLFDLGHRNRLLNFRETARSSVKITAPQYEELFSILVREEHGISFPLVIDESDYENSEDDSVSDSAQDESQTGNVTAGIDNIAGSTGQEKDYGNMTSRLRTSKTVGELQKALRSIRSKARIFQEEQGINVLYLCFGFLKWTEADHSDIAYSAPLILVPVSLGLASITSPFTMYLHEDEIVVNPTLAYKLSNDFGIVLPDFEENQPLDEFFAKVSQVTTRLNWSVNTDVALGLFSFLKINMVNDIKKHKDSISAHPIVRALSGDRSGLTHISDDLINYDFDKNDDPKNIFQIVDADSSQQEAILMAKKGISFVLQGPPGTGKSQTITNIIAESLAQGKKVLFVSEKMAALDVVYRRLTTAGLNDFCLVLHSHKANKRNILDQLDNVLQLSGKRAKVTEEAYSKLANLESDRKKLNEYAEQVFSVVQPLGYSIYQANGEIANRSESPDVIFTINDVGNTSREEYYRYINCLKSYVSAIKKMSVDYRHNPWRDTKVNTLTFELRHEISSRLPALAETLKQGYEGKIPQLFDEIFSVFPYTISGISNAIDMLGIMNGAYMVPVSWVMNDPDSSVMDSITKYVFLCNEYKKAIKKLDDCYQNLSNWDLLDYVAADELGNPVLQTQQIELIDSILNDHPLYSSWKKENFDTVRQFFKEAKAQATSVLDIRNLLLRDFDEGIFDVDFSAMLGRFKAEYTSVMKNLKKNYKDDKKFFLTHMKVYGRKLRDEEIVDALQKIQKSAELEKWFAQNKEKLNKYFGDNIVSSFSDYDAFENIIEKYGVLFKAKTYLEQLNKYTTKITTDDEYLHSAYGPLYHGPDTDWNEICSAYKWAESFRKVYIRDGLKPEFVEKVCFTSGYAKRCLEIRDELSAFKQDILPNLQWFDRLFTNTETVMDRQLDELSERVSDCSASLSALEEYIDFSSVRKMCVDNGLAEYIDVVEKQDFPADQIIDAFCKLFFRLWLDAIMPRYPAVQEFRRRTQDETIDEFRKLDKIQFEIARERIKGMLLNALPSLDQFTNGVDELSVLKRELAKQKKIMPLRKLFSAIPNLLLTLKPCLMMSPLSVSLFLESDDYKFDLVVFDEASQVYTENAIGAISRGKQVIIAGDSKQLPPTNFFQAAIADESFEDDDEEDDEQYNVYDSILEEANGLPERTLRWHYRSRHESLIAFSNAKIYRNQLITFPSNIETRKNIGVEYIHVPEGFYDRGGRKGNVPEARTVAKLVFEHIKKYPDRSLGVIAFGEIQQVAIENALREMRLENMEFEPFFDEGNDEPFFIKSLENVQGDERDTIIFSIGYAPDANGIFRMNFGPLGKSGGERRLNVAITRAKYNVKLVGSIRPDQINIDSIHTDGPKLLRYYIDYAMNGPSVLANTIEESDSVDYDSPFEEAVYNFLDRKGYKLTTQVGCSGYRIDIGVKHPEISGAYVLGIECDGASYHSSRTARERDRLRQDVLENMGWKLYRIWSTDWIKDPNKEGEKLIEAVNNAILSYCPDQRKTNSSAASDTVEQTGFVEIKTKSRGSLEKNPYGFDWYTPIDFADYVRRNGLFPNLRSCITYIVKREYPIHYDLLCQLVANAMAGSRVTSGVRGTVDTLIPNIPDIQRKGDFFFPSRYDKIPVRIPNQRTIQYIHTEELAAAMCTILKSLMGTNRKGLADETARVYGFARTGSKISEAMNGAIEYLLANDLIEEKDDKITLKR